MSSVDEQVIDFHYELFDRVFTQPFRPKIKERLRQDAVARQVQEAAGAASQALTRFFLSQQLSDAQVAEILRGFLSLYDLIRLEDVANPNYTPESLVEELLKKHPCPATVGEVGAGPIYRVALHQTVQVLMLVGPVMTEWQKLSFSSTYEMPRRIVSQLNQITEGLKAFAGVGQEAADERYELAYRDHLLQRFYRVEAGTVRMTTNLYVDLRELFVMPRLKVRPKKKTTKTNADEDVYMNLSEARAVFEKIEEDAKSDGKDERISALEQIKLSKRNIIVGFPGGGKSTLFEWLQLSLANVDEELIAGDRQAIPLLLRVRQLDPKNLPRGADLIEKATASHDRATLMPPGWIERQMEAGRVFFMLDGLDETEPQIRDEHILPWFTELCSKYPDCHYLLSSRPVGYRSGGLHKLKFAECDLEDFSEPEIAEYTRHWCTAIRLARNEPDEEARREGTKEGDEIVAGFKGHSYIRNLARNPLMLSAVCLVNYFEGGELPKDRAVLYRLCVEGLLHHWDQRRGIRSDYSLDQKLRVSREVAIAMQNDDRAEYEFAKILKIFTGVLKNTNRAKNLLEHIRYRSGLLIERRAGVFAFAHLTFQEYLAARAVYEGNHLNLAPEKLSLQHADGRWNEVIALYCGLASSRAAGEMIKSLIKQPNTDMLARVLAEAFLSSISDVNQNSNLRTSVVKRIAVSPMIGSNNLDRFPVRDVAPFANSLVKANTELMLSESYDWLFQHPKQIKTSELLKRLQEWKTLTPWQLCEVLYLVHGFGSDRVLGLVAGEPLIYRAEGPRFGKPIVYETAAEVALTGLAKQFVKNPKFGGPGTDSALLQILRTLVTQNRLGIHQFYTWESVFKKVGIMDRKLVETWPEYVRLARQLAARLGDKESTARVLRGWANRLETALKQTLKSNKRRLPQRLRHFAGAKKKRKTV